MRTLPILVAAFLAVPSQAQIEKLWTRHHGGPAGLDDYGWNVAVDPAGSAYAAGTTTNALGDQDLLLVKYGGSGLLQWTATYAGPGGGRDVAWAVEVDAAGNVLVAGDSFGAGTDSDIVTLKYAPDGTLLWVRRYDGPASGWDAMDQGVCLSTDPAGNVFAGGYSLGLGTGYDAVVLKYAPDGTFLWEARTNGLANATDNPTWILADAAGNVHVAGRVSNLAGPDIFVAKYDPDGALLWQQEYDGPASGYDYPFGLALGPGGEVVVTGVSPAAGTGEDAVTILYDANGNLGWEQRYDGANAYDYGLTVAVSTAGRVAVTGGTSDPYDQSALTLLYDADGALLWSETYNVTWSYIGNDYGVDVGFDAAGNVSVGGGGWGGYERGYEAFLVQYAPDGSLAFEDQLDGPAHGDELFTRQVLAGEKVYLVGLSQQGEEHLDLLVAKYGEPKSQLGSSGSLERKGPNTPGGAGLSAERPGRLPHFGR